MKSLKTIIRVQKWKLDEKRRALRDMEELLDGFKLQLSKLDIEHVREQQIAADNPEIGIAYANYALAAKQRRENLLASIEGAVREVEIAGDEIAELFQELKRYEISEEARLVELKAEQDKQFQAEMDDLSIEMHRRKPKDGV